jgi:DNA-binding CsgD family transcriptional regulator
MALLERAVRLAERGQEPFELARSLLALGRVQRRLKHRGAARDTLVRAEEIFEQLGMPLWKDRAGEELSRIGGRPRRPSGLSETETRVARLAADGLTNREIAAALFLSVNTVQAYLKRVYRELGIRSRTELARKLPPAG